MKVKLPGSGVETSRLGFGTAGLHGGLSRRSSLRLLDASFEHGIRHFDTAPLYGLGAAENVVGEFLARRKDKVTVATKFGLLPPRAPAFWETMRALARPIVSRMPALKRKLVNAMATTSAPFSAPRPRFTSAEMRASLDTSLRALRRNQVELFLLHEADASDINDDLRQALEKVVSEGLIGAWGIASARTTVAGILERTDTSIDVFQFDQSALAQPLVCPAGALVITHGSLSATRGRPFVDEDWRQRLSKAMGFDVDEPGAMARLLISAAMANNSGGLVLFTSRQLSHIQQVCQHFGREDEASGRMFLDFVQKNPERFGPHHQHQQD